MNRACLAACSICFVLAACGGGSSGGGGTESDLTPFTVSVSVSGLNGTAVLQNNGANNLSVSANGTATFTATLTVGVKYNVTVLTQPAGQNCDVPNGSGTVGRANVVNINVNCSLIAPTVAVSPGLKQLQFSWSANPAATFYRVLENPDGVSGYAQSGPDLSVTNFTLGFSAVLLSKRLNALYVVESCNSFGCTDSAPLPFAAHVVKAIGYFKASNAGGADIFGTAIALSSDGNTLAVGAPAEAGALVGITPGAVSEAAAGNGVSKSGAVYVFARTGNSWGQQAYVKASNADANDQFGTAVALSADGSTLAVGATGESSALTGVTGGAVSEGTSGNGALNAGAVYVFLRSGTSWAQQAYVKASNSGANDAFGVSVALSADGNMLAVGATLEDSALTTITPGTVNEATAGNGATDAGAVYVFLRTGSTWSQQAYIKASNAGAGDFFGLPVALNADGTTLAVGAVQESSALTGITPNTVSEPTAGNGAAGSGAVYVFTRSGTVWSQQAYVKASNTGASDQFGGALALSGDGNTLAVGAVGEASSLVGVMAGSVNDVAAGNDASGAGAVYVFTRAATLWSQQAYVKASNSEMFDFFGTSVALSGDGNTLAVGAIGESASLKGALAGPVSEGAVDNLAYNSGAVYVFGRTAGAWSQAAFLKASNTQGGCRPPRPGTRCAVPPPPAPDLNGDGFGSRLALSGDGNTLAVGTAGEDGGAPGIGGDQTDDSATDAGALYLY